MGRWRWRAALLVLLVSGCGGGEAEGGADAGVSADAHRSDAGSILAPAMPVEPAIAPCPEGWREVAGPPATCDPWPEGGPPACADDETFFPGGTACERLGTACGADAWATDLPAGASIRYVSAEAAPGGDGSRSAPFALIGDAVRVAAHGDVIAIGKGTYDEEVTLVRGVTLWGACVAETRIASTAPAAMEPTIAVNSVNVEVRNLSVGGARPGIVVYPGAAASFTSVLVADAVSAGVVFLGTGNTANDLAVRDVRPTAAGLFGRGVIVEAGGAAEMSRLSIERTHEAALSVASAGSRATVSAMVVRDTEPRASDGLYGRAIDCYERAEVDGTDVVIERNADVAVTARADAVVRLTGAVIRDGRPSPVEGSFGRGVDANQGGRIELRRALIERVRDVAIGCHSPGSSLLIEDAVVRDTAARDFDGWFGRGLSAHDGCSVELRRAWLARNEEMGLFVDGAETTMTVEDVRVEDTSGLAIDGQFGRGMIVQNGASVVMMRGLFAGNHEVGIYAMGSGTTLSAFDIRVRETRSRVADGQLGRALHAQGSAIVHIERAAFEGNREAAVLATDEGTDVRLLHTVVTDTQPSDCEGTTCMGIGAGLGFGTYYGAHIAAEHFAVLRSSFVGVQIARNGAVDLMDGLVAENPFAVNLQVAGYDVARLQTRVVYRDNEVDLNATELPVPATDVGF